MLMPVTPDALGVHLGARCQVVQGHQVVAQHHAPKGAADPEIELAGGHLAVATRFRGAARAAPIALAEAVGVNAQYHEPAPGKRRPGRFGRVFGLEEFFLADVVFAAVPVAIEDGRRLAAGILRQQQVAGDSCAGGVIELELLQRVLPAVLPQERFHLGCFWPGRQFAQQFPKLGPDLLTLGLPRGPGAGHTERRGEVGLRQPAQGVALVGLGHQDAGRAVQQRRQG